MTRPRVSDRGGKIRNSQAFVRSEAKSPCSTLCGQAKVDMELVRLRDLLSPYPAAIRTWEAALADTVHMRIGSARPALGKSAVLPCLAVLFNAIEAIDSKTGQFWKIREALLAEIELRWRVSSGTSLVVPCFVVVRARQELIEDLRFYCDLWALPHGRRFRAGLGDAARAGPSDDAA